MKNMRHFLLFLLPLMTLASCAEMAPLTGGERDAEPPKLDSSKYSTPNKSINFAEDEIILTFNEWIQLDQAQNKILISPPLDEKPIIKLKHKSLVIKFKNPLRENTTYNINLGDAVKDLSEGNIAKNFNFVFSTGSFIDSLKVKGTIVDAQTAQPKENVWVMLYDELADSVPLKQKPYYITKTNKEGQFLIDNIKSDSFKIFALLDKNSNYIFDNPTEEIGFWHQNFYLTDSTQPTIQLQLFLPEQPLKILSQRNINKSTTKITFNKSTNQAKNEIQPLFALPAGFQILQYANADSLTLWCVGALQPDSTYLFLRDGQDTIKLNFASSADSLPKPSIIPATAQKTSNKSSAKKMPLPPIKVAPAKPLPLLFNAPIASLDTQFVKVYKDTILDSNRIQPPLFVQDSGRVNQMLADVNTWNSGVYIFIFLPNSLKNCFGLSNTDTLRQTVQIMKPADFGRLSVNITHLDTFPDNQFVFQLVKGKDEIVFTKFFGSGQDTSHVIDFDLLEPASYTGRLVFDRNKNNQWDSGQYPDRQPERVINTKAVSVRADWDNELEINLNPAPTPKSSKAGIKKGG